MKKRNSYLLVPAAIVLFLLIGEIMCIVKAIRLK
jgi:hypothetical protein